MDEVIKELESSANMLRGMAFDSRIPNYVRDFMGMRASRIDDLLKKLSKPSHLTDGHANTTCGIPRR